MTETQICRLLGIRPEERERLFAEVGLFNHEWDNPERLIQLGTLSPEETREISNGLLSEEVPVTINERISGYDCLLVLGPVFPHEVVGFSGGTSISFPESAGTEILNFFHWLGVLITNEKIIGVEHTPVRTVVDRAARLDSSRAAWLHLAFVVANDARLHGLFYGTPEAGLGSRGRRPVRTRPHPPRPAAVPAGPVLPRQCTTSCGWPESACTSSSRSWPTGGELIICASFDEISITHGKLIEEIGYHVRDYFTAQWEKFQHFPRGILAHSTHVRGGGTYIDGIERPRVQVTLATGLSPESPRQSTLGIDIELAPERAARCCGWPVSSSCSRRRTTRRCATRVTVRKRARRAHDHESARAAGESRGGGAVR